MPAIVKQEVEVASGTGKGAKIGGEWYNSKVPVFREVSKGSVVSFEYSEGSSGGKFVKGQVTVDSEAPAASGYSGGAKKSSSDYGLGAAVGMAINNAITICMAEKESYDVDFVKKKAVEIYTMAEEFKQHAANGAFDPAPPASEEEPEPEPSGSEVKESKSPF